MNKFTILGSGSSLGAPWITNHWGNLKKNLKMLEQDAVHIFNIKVYPY